MTALLNVLDRTWSLDECQEFVGWCEDQGIWFWEIRDDPGHLRYRGPISHLDPTFKRLIQAHRTEIVLYLRVRKGEHPQPIWARGGG